MSFHPMTLGVIERLRLIDALKSYSKATSEELRSTAVTAKIDRLDAVAVKALVAYLVQRIDNNPDLSEKSILWGALGNAGTDDVWTAVQSSYETSPPALRHRLSNALRFVAGPEAREFLLEKVRSGENASIRLSSVEALTFRKLSLGDVDRMGIQLQKETDGNVQSAILHLLYNKSSKYPQVLNYIERFVDARPGADLANTFRRLLENPLTIQN